jgi:hypothetical protein
MYPKVPHPLPTDPPPAKTKPYISPDIVANGQPAADEPRYGFIGDDTLLTMYIPTVGYILIRTHGKDAGIALFTEAEVANGQINPRG